MSTGIALGDQVKSTRVAALETGRLGRYLLLNGLRGEQMVRAAGVRYEIWSL